MYDQNSWLHVVEEYTRELTMLEIPPDLSPSGLIELQSRLDRLYTKVRLEHCQLAAELARLKEAYKVKSKIYYLEVKDQARTEKEREALVYRRLCEDRYQGYELPEAVSILQGQVAFLETVSSLISSKAQRLVSVLGSLKLEQSIMAIEVAGEMAQARARAS